MGMGFLQSIEKFASVSGGGGLSRSGNGSVNRCRGRSRIGSLGIGVSSLPILVLVFLCTSIMMGASCVYVDGFALQPVLTGRHFRVQNMKKNKGCKVISWHQTHLSRSFCLNVSDDVDDYADGEDNNDEEDNDDEKKTENIQDFLGEDSSVEQDESPESDAFTDLNWRVEKLRLEEANTRRFLKAGPRFLPYDECTKWVQAWNRWESEEEWKSWIDEGEKRNSYIPARPDEYYGNRGEWKGWDHFLGNVVEDEGDDDYSDDFQ
jgi:hypothetical protein